MGDTCTSRKDLNFEMLRRHVSRILVCEGMYGTFESHVNDQDQRAGSSIVTISHAVLCFHCNVAQGNIRVCDSNRLGMDSS